MTHDEVTLDKESERACAERDPDQKWIKGDPKYLKSGSKVDDGLAMAGGEGGVVKAIELCIANIIDIHHDNVPK